MSHRRTFLKSTAAATVGAAMLGGRAYAAPAKADWIELFDGKSLAGWHKNPKKIGHGTGGIWRAENGTITGEQDPPGSGNGGILSTDLTFGDFELLIDMQPDWGVCSGLFLRGNDQGQCFQMMVDYHDAGNVGHLYGEGTTGFNTRTFDINGTYDDDRQLVGITTANHKTVEQAGVVESCTPQQWVDAWKVNDWNTARVRVEGAYPKITTWINDVLVCEFDGTNSTAARYDKESIFKQLGANGQIAVQVHGGNGWPTGAKCSWKNIRVRHLSG